MKKRRLQNDASDSPDLGASAEDVLMEVLIETATTDAGDIKADGIVSTSPSEELDPDCATLHSKQRNMQGSLSDWEGHDLTDDDLYDILLEIEEELRVDGT